MWEYLFIRFITDYQITYVSVGVFMEVKVSKPSKVDMPEQSNLQK